MEDNIIVNYQIKNLEEWTKLKSNYELFCKYFSIKTKEEVTLVVSEKKYGLNQGFIKIYQESGKIESVKYKNKNLEEELGNFSIGESRVSAYIRNQEFVMDYSK